jgi:large repetitive protein
VTVPFTVSGTAASPDDFTVSPAGAVTFQPGQTTRTITITVADDAAPEADETVVLTLGAATNAALGAAAVYPETIEDRPGSVVSPPSRSYMTAGGSAVTFTVALTGDPSAAVVLPVATADPTEGTVAVTELVFTAADTGVPRTVTVTGADDGVNDFNQASSVLLGAAASEDARYAGLDPADVDRLNVELLPRGKGTFADADGTGTRSN